MGYVGDFFPSPNVPPTQWLRRVLSFFLPLPIPNSLEKSYQIAEKREDVAGKGTKCVGREVEAEECVPGQL